MDADVSTMAKMAAVSIEGVYGSMAPSSLYTVALFQRYRARAIARMEVGSSLVENKSNKNPISTLKSDEKMYEEKKNTAKRFSSLL